MWLLIRPPIRNSLTRVRQTSFSTNLRQKAIACWACKQSATCSQTGHPSRASPGWPRTCLKEKRPRQPPQNPVLSPNRLAADKAQKNAISSKKAQFTPNKQYGVGLGFSDHPITGSPDHPISEP